VVPAICVSESLFVKIRFFTYSHFRLAAEYFQLAAIVMLIYDQSKPFVVHAKVLSEPSTKLRVSSSAKVRPGGLSVTYIHWS